MAMLNRLEDTHHHPSSFLVCSHRRSEVPLVSALLQLKLACRADHFQGGLKMIGSRETYTQKGV